MILNDTIHVKDYDKCTKNTLTNKHTYVQKCKHGENGKNGEWNWMTKVAPLRMAILAKHFAKYRQRAGDIENVVNIQIGCQCVHFWTYLNKQQMWRNREKIIRITLQGMGTGVHWDVWVNVGHDDPPQLGNEVTILLLVLVPLFVLHLPRGAEHDPQADQLLTWM